MRTLQRFTILLCILPALFMGATRADAACRQCSSNFVCLSASEGALLCLAFGDQCTMAGACYAMRPEHDGGLDDPLMDALTSVTVLDEAPAALGSTGVRIERAMGGDLAADGAARGWAARSGGSPRPTLLAGLMHGQGIPIAVRTREGDGFVLERRDTHRGIKLVVRSMFAGQPGHVIMSRFVEEDDLVALRAPIGGRNRVVLLHVLRLSTARDTARIEALQAAVAESARERRGKAAIEVDLVPMPE